jgi:hypothetical protein
VGSVRFRLPSPSMAVALLALFVALGGSSYAALKVSGKQIVNNSVRSKDLRNNDVRSADVRNNALTGADINEARVGTVPRANTANSAATATSATNATKAATADDANALGGIAPGGYVQTPTEATRLVGTPGNPPFEDGYANFGQGAPAGFFKDQFGIVHLQGDVNPPGFASTIFTLPPGYRPTHDGATGPQFLVPADTSTGVVDVRFDGQVRVLSSFNNNVSINGVTFRAAG